MTATQAPAPTAGAPSPDIDKVAVTRDVRYASSQPDFAPWFAPLLDIYAPPGARGLPLIVMFPPHGLGKDQAGAFAQLATSVAERGAVAVVASWSQADDPPSVFADPAALETIASLGQSVASCAVSYVVANAAVYGADPARLVLLGELYGGNVAGMLALGSAAPFPGCDATGAWKAAGLVGWDADWMVAMPAWDALGADAARAVSALSPWPSLADAPRIPVELVVTEIARKVSARCDDRDAAWMVARDPNGVMRRWLDEVGAYADGCVDLGDAAEATVAAMQDVGVPAELVALSDRTTTDAGGGHIGSLGAADTAMLVQAALKAAGTAPTP